MAAILGFTNFTLLITQIVFLTLKVSGVINWNWLFVMSPAILFLVIFGFVIYVINAAFGR